MNRQGLDARLACSCIYVYKAENTILANYYFVACGIIMKTVDALRKDIANELKVSCNRLIHRFNERNNVIQNFHNYER